MCARHPSLWLGQQGKEIRLTKKPEHNGAAVLLLVDVLTAIRFSLWATKDLSVDERITLEGRSDGARILRKGPGIAFAIRREPTVVGATECGFAYSVL